MPLPRLTGPVLAFSRFRLAREAGLLMADGAVIDLAARPFAVLAALLDAGGRVVSAAELRDEVWNGTHVDANTIQSQISAIRRALDEERDLIVTVPGRGYRFGGKVHLVEPPGVASNSGAAGTDGARENRIGSPSGTGEAHAGFSRRLDVDAHRATRHPARFSGTPSTGRYGDHGDHGDHGARPPAAPGPGGVEAALRAQAGVPLTPFTGRHAELSELLAVVPARRVVTLTGAAGIGKTRLAAEAASRLASHFRDGVFWVDLASLSQPEGIANAIGTALGLSPAPEYGIPAALAARLGGRRMLIVIDHCDGLGEPAALAIDALIAGTSALHVLVTAQLPLFIAGELPVAVAPLRAPAAGPGSQDANASVIMPGHDSLQLLLARLALKLTQGPGPASNEREPRASAAPVSLAALAALRTMAPVSAPHSSVSQAWICAARICHRVDGLPLALEIAAAAIAARTQTGASDERCAQPALYAALTACAGELDALVARRAGASRIALPHAETLRTVLEWSCATLDDTTLAALRRLSVFAGTFSRLAALDLLSAFSCAAVRPCSCAPHAEDTGCSGAAAFDPVLQRLVSAGFVNATEDPESHPCARLRLPPAVRRFALEALDRHREIDAAAAHHANHFARQFARRTWAGTHAGSRAAPHARAHGADCHDIDNLRTALEWALTSDKVELCAELLDHSAPLWLALALRDEYAQWIRAALARAHAAPVRLIHDEMRLHAALARALPPTRAAAPEIAANWTRAYALATECADTQYRLRALFSLVLSALDAGDVARAAPLVSDFGDIAAIAQCPAALINARRLEGLMRVWQGEFNEAIRLLAPLIDWRAQAGGRPPPDSEHPAGQPIDHEALLEADAMAISFGLSLHPVAMAMLAAARWFAGVALPGALHVPGDDGDAIGRSAALALSCALAVLDGDAARAQAGAALLVACARLAGLRRWLRAGLDVHLWLDARDGDHDAARRLLEGAARRIGRDQVYLLDVAFLATLLPRTPLDNNPALAATLGAAIRMALRRAERVGELWHTPELQRIDAALRLAAGEPHETVRALLEAALARAQHFNAQRIALRITVDIETLELPRAGERGERNNHGDQSGRRERVRIR
ncbi:MAG: winged helix-turn-helix domain-containing protein [Paraburkholderia sp.]|jgi:predicted ATPase/DNA-binding winged helix-turn-helix (wHTH) protein|nr:winged helix-turn-helix domain-containing protein [Paraburkholderia sp.]